ncbi:hypothetical protein GLOIN_2v1515806 [Rhizophagus irregularis DAOM 181602=DAOM 197198]|uniref:Uncharacterized protein n=1 Tax=Rhizophagus irregularis (strain DAOM 181602 / DAOM 197198 / MUCL 43194) TaxID=747089 RepID=A0A2P4QS77_RHIID|nr:hypothetical protein GLOIN_2v1515806 [Rhizophagus irregularis DAOM 181602=DAOM 197198]POG80503.1 hypothetical protein GLOIN_2v1515806 [Rhizophagus irregularis DAOM 181602=DAOM 197198]|eukprot:XP_025187369.1 hypothetical protein GLOIN_2v1515806 [Rhizophagus irregularis DAOM 181602=DAOM 197198]
MFLIRHFLSLITIVIPSLLIPMMNFTTRMMIRTFLLILIFCRGSLLLFFFHRRLKISEASIKRPDLIRIVPSPTSFLSPHCWTSFLVRFPNLFEFLPG